MAATMSAPASLPRLLPPEIRIRPRGFFFACRFGGRMSSRIVKNSYRGAKIIQIIFFGALEHQLSAIHGFYFSLGRLMPILLFSFAWFYYM
jgi:hypothetical protein